MTEIYVVGANGQLGRCLQSTGVRWHFLTSKDLNFLDTKSIAQYFKNKNADCILNLAAYNLVDKAETEKDVAMAINATASAELAKVCKSYFYVSTDYVFSGNSKKPYKEDDKCEPLGAYSESKYLGEKWAQEINKNTYVIRTAWLYSEHAQNYVKSMLELAKTRSELKIVADQFGTPTYAQDLAEVLKAMVLGRANIAPGVYHYSNEGECSRYDFTKEIFRLKNIKISLLPIATSEYPTPAKRPAYSVLDKTKIKSAMNIEVPHWATSLEKCLKKL